MNTKNKAILLAMLIISFISVFFLWTNISDKKRQLELRMASEQKLADVTYNVILSQIRQELYFEAQKIASSEEIARAFANGDRQGLFDAMKPHYDQLSKKYQLMAFVSADNRHFLRMHDPKNFGDDMSKKRPVIALSNLTKAKIAAFEATNYGVEFIQIYPVFYNNEYVGFFHIGTSAATLQQRLGVLLDAKSALFFDMKNLGKFSSIKPSRVLGEWGLVSSSDQLFSSLPDDFDFEKTQRVEMGGKTYIMHVFPMNDYRGATIAKKIFAQDITADVNESKSLIERAIVLILVLLIGVYFVLHVSFDVLISQIEGHEHELMHQLYTDSLTGLPNRASLRMDLQGLKKPELALLNVDDFKEINDLYGIAVGDFILKEIARRLEGLIADNAKLFRLSGDEFGLLCSTGCEKGLEAFVASLLAQFSKEIFAYNNNEVIISLTAGAALGAESIFEHADMALKNAKKQRKQLVVFSKSMEIAKEYENNIKWTKILKDAIENDRITSFYQPIVNTATGRIEKYECLVRIRTQDGKVIPPHYFLPIAQKSKLYTRLTHAVAKEAFKTFTGSKYGFSINLALEDILNPQTTAMLIDFLNAHQRPERVVFEILESDGIENYDSVAEFIRKVKHTGAKIAIDDFGTGYSNFGHLLKLDVDFIKIDASMIKNIDHDENSQIIVETIVGFAKRLNIKTVAEFVHSKEVYDTVKRIGIDYSQGYYLGEPQAKLEGASYAV